MTGLTSAEMEVLEFERLTFTHQGIKDDAIRGRWGHSSTRHFQKVAAILDKPEAETYDPTLVRRLRRIRDARAARRGGGRA